MRLLASPRARAWFLSTSLLVILGGDAWRYSIGWVAFAVLAVALAAVSVYVLIANRDRWSIGGLPYPLIVFMVLATLSLAWSFYPTATALGLLNTWLTVLGALAVATSFSWQEILDATARALRILLVVSIAFELFVATVIRQPVVPLAPQPELALVPGGPVPLMLQWSRNVLFDALDGGRIQGIVGNANHLGFLALLALIVFAIQWARGTLTRGSSLVWLALAALTLFLARSATVTVALVAVIVTAVAILFIRSRHSDRARATSQIVFFAAIVTATTVLFTFRDVFFGLLSKSEDLTGRAEIWQSVTALAQQRPVFGWGWVSVWMPWAEPFSGLAQRNGVVQVQAHDAWLDVWLQLGVVGVAAFAAIAITTVVRTWSLAVDRPQRLPGQPLAFTAGSLAPMLVMVALLVQSIPESRLLGEYGLYILVIIAVKAKRPDWSGTLQ
ncbi:O-antigen ligase domain-containing protein [Salinibacterium sp. UTAS2018]|uniref:O-antigen ligase family protein n=1 Tax=Salinibacterium sp. UTAS2018 TaxID=2508880 RepID=UPI0010096662|nr:O-antigen ligase family protein [Salinibacterium sp. UTAS2018]QAV69969.1 O-antigen ligase domain-containing protein [Salinibacterium sp. UTAS2018]